MVNGVDESGLPSLFEWAGGLAPLRRMVDLFYDRVEADEVRAALEACGGDRDRVCRMLGISKTTLWRKLNAAA